MKISTAKSVIAFLAFTSTALAAVVQDATPSTASSTKEANTLVKIGEDAPSNPLVFQSLRYSGDYYDDSGSGSDSEDSCDDSDAEYGYYSLRAESRKRSGSNGKVAANAHGVPKGVKKLRQNLKKHNNHTKTTNKLISQLIQENINANNEDDNSSKVALLWFKLANLILPYEKTAKKVEEQLKKDSLKTKKVSVPNDQLVEGKNVESRLVSVNEIPAVNVVDSDALVQHNSDSPEVNLAGLLGNLFGKIKGGDDDDCAEEEEDDSCDDDEDDKYTYHDPCDFYETSVKMGQAKFDNSTAFGSGQNGTGASISQSSPATYNSTQVNVSHANSSSLNWASDSDSGANTHQVYFPTVAVGLAAIFAAV